MKLTILPLIPPRDWAAIQAVLPVLWVEDTVGLVGRDETGTLVAAGLMDNWTNNSVQMHLFIKTPMVLKYGFIETAFDFVFNNGGVNYIYGMVPGDNEKAIKLNKHMGFTEKTRLVDGWGDGIDYVVMELKKENCRYLPTRPIDPSKKRTVRGDHPNGEEIKRSA